MKSLYKSILDDEDTLISNSIKDSQDPFTIVYNLLKNEEDENVVFNTVNNGIFDKFIEKKLLLDPKQFEIIVEQSQTFIKIISFYPKNEPEYTSTFQIVYYPDWPDTLQIRIISKTYMEDVIVNKYIGNKHIQELPWLETKLYKQYSKVCSNIKKEGFNKVSKIDKNYTSFEKKMI